MQGTLSFGLVLPCNLVSMVLIVGTEGVSTAVCTRFSFLKVNYKILVSILGT
jgi:hypothetical protein